MKHVTSKVNIVRPAHACDKSEIAYFLGNNRYIALALRKFPLGYGKFPRSAGNIQIIPAKTGNFLYIYLIDQYFENIYIKTHICF